MASLVKKIVKIEHTDVQPAANGMTYGQILDEQIADALHNSSNDYIMEFNLIFEEAEWHEMRQNRRERPPSKTRI